MDFDKKILSILRKVPTEEFLLRGSKRVYVFKAVDCLKTLAFHGYNADQIKYNMNFLLKNNIVYKVTKNDERDVDLSFNPNFTHNDLYIWDKEDNNKIKLILFSIFAFSFFVFFVFKKNPRIHRTLLYYASNICFLLFILLCVIAFIRLVVYFYTLVFCRQQLWLLPNLFADKGFIDSFIPSHEWTKEKNE